MSGISPQKQPIRAVIFDWDFTLIEHNGRFLQNTAESLQNILKYPVSDKDREQRVRDFYKTQNARLIPGAAETIHSLLKQEIPVLIVSRSPDTVLKEMKKKLLDPELEKIDQTLAEKISVHGSTSEPESKKPHPEAFQKPLRAKGIEPGRDVLMVGDRFETDFKGGYEAGLTPILFGARPKDEILAKRYATKKSLPFREASNHQSLRDLIQQTIEYNRDRDEFALPAELSMPPHR